MRAQAMKSEPGDSLEAWLRRLPDGGTLAELAVYLRATTGAAGAGGAAEGDPDVVARYFRGGPRTESELIRLWDEAELRRSVASVGRLLAASESMRGGFQSVRLGRRWLGAGALVAASIVGLMVVPTLLDDGPLDAEHRSATRPTAEVRIVAPTAVEAASPRVEWHPVLGAEVYEVEVTDARGRTVFSERTAGTALEIPTRILDPGNSYFFRVRAQLDVARWISSDFQEIVVSR